MFSSVDDQLLIIDVQDQLLILGGKNFVASAGTLPRPTRTSNSYLFELVADRQNRKLVLTALSAEALYLQP